MARRYRRLLRWYPRRWRELNEQVVLAILLDVNDARGGDGPTFAEAWSLRLHGFAHRMRKPGASTFRPRGKRRAGKARTTRWIQVSTVLGAATMTAVAVTGWAAASSGGDGRDLRALQRSTTPYQLAILADGVVTDAEYERAFTARRDCVVEAGATPSETYDVGNRELTFDYDITASTTGERARREALADACIPRFYAEVGALWIQQNQ